MRKADLIIKYSDEQGGETAYGALQQLLAAHFTSPFRYRVPRPYGYGREPALLIQERVQGNQWIRLLLDHPSDSHWASDRAASWLVRLQKTALAAPHLVSEAQHETVARKMSAQIQALATSFPSAAARLNTVGHLLQQHDAFWEETPRVPSHGDYHAGNVLLTATTTTVIDFDAFGLRGPSFDVGYCIAQLLSMSYFRTGSLAPGAQAATRFWRTYRRYGGGATWPKVVGWVSLTLLHNLHYTLCAMHAEQGHILPWWLDMIEHWASAHTPDVLERFSQ
jgi:aminoglycoside phosphotransferase (APT) family kinase protein